LSYYFPIVFAGTFTVHAACDFKSATFNASNASSLCGESAEFLIKKLAKSVNFAVVAIVQ
ncbi:MAG: hypothetical protein ACKPER_07030, partial [Dolichospermum sp.]